MLRYNGPWMKPALLAGALSLGATGAAFAAANNPEQGEMAGVQSAQVAPVNAIKAAEAKSGARAVDFGYEKNATTNAYEVTVATGSGLSMMQVDPTTGAISGATAHPANALAGDGLPANDVAKAAAAPIRLDAAVAAAENAGGGRALEANYTVRQGQLSVDVDVLKNGATRAYTVNATTGQVTQAAPAEKSANAKGDGDGEADND